MDFEMTGPERSALDRLKSPERMAKGIDCPPEDELVALAAGQADAAREDTLLEHAGGCDRCSTLLRELAAALTADPSPEDEALAQRLPSSTAAGREQLIGRLVAKPRAKAGWWWAGVAVAAALAGMWVFPIWQMQQAESKVAAEYRRERPGDFRVDGMPYGPALEARGPKARRPIPLPGGAPAPLVWRAELAAGRYPEAVALLEKAAQADPAPGIRNDLAAAYALRAHALRDAGGFAAALEILDRVIRENPRYGTARWNRAMVLREMGRREEYRAELEEFQRIEPSGEWNQEAGRRLNLP